MTIMRKKFPGSSSLCTVTITEMVGPFPGYKLLHPTTAQPHSWAATSTHTCQSWIEQYWALSFFFMALRWLYIANTRYSEACSFGSSLMEIQRQSNKNPHTGSYCTLYPILQKTNALHLPVVLAPGLQCLFMIINPPSNSWDGSNLILSVPIIVLWIGYCPI